MAVLVPSSLAGQDTAELQGIIEEARRAWLRHDFEEVLEEFGADTSVLVDLVRSCRAATRKPVIVKLAPTLPDVAATAEAAAGTLRQQPQAVALPLI